MVTSSSKGSLIFVILYLLICFGISVYYLQYIFLRLPSEYGEFKLLLSCTAISTIGGIFYCLRGVYLSYCVKDVWNEKWIPWYLLRPFTSLISGGASYLFLKAGLLVLDAKVQSPDANLGFYALAFVAGLNVDRFIHKIEDLAQVAWGIAKSRSSSDDTENR